MIRTDKIFFGSGTVRVPARSENTGSGSGSALANIPVQVRFSVRVQFDTLVARQSYSKRVYGDSSVELHGLHSAAGGARVSEKLTGALL